jgi:acyl-CoA thioesterase
MAVGTALDSLDLPDMASHATVDLSVSYLEAAQGQHLFAEGRMLRVGRTIAVGEAEVHDDDGRLVAKGRATYLIWRQNDVAPTFRWAQGPSSDRKNVNAP